MLGEQNFITNNETDIKNTVFFGTSETFQSFFTENFFKTDRHRTMYFPSKMSIY